MGRSSRAMACRNLRIIETSRFTEYRDINLYLPQRQPKAPAWGRAGTGVIGGRQAAEGRFAERSQFGGSAFPGWEGMEWVGGAGPGGPARTGASALLVQEQSQFESEGLLFRRVGWGERRDARPGVSSVPDGRGGWSAGCHSCGAGGGGRPRSRHSRRGRVRRRGWVWSDLRGGIPRIGRRRAPCGGAANHCG